MIAATLTTRLAQDGIDKRAITAFSLAFLAYNLKWLWAWAVDGVRLPILGRLGQRVSWLLLAGTLVMAAIVNLALVDPSASLTATATAAILVAIASATYDIVIDAYRIETLEPRQLGVGSGMNQYGWRIGSVAAGSLALVVAGRSGWQARTLRARYSPCRDGSRVGPRRAGAASGARAPRARHGGPVGGRAARGVPAAQRRAARLVVRARPQGRRYARQPHVPAVVRRFAVHERRNSDLRRGLRILGLPRGNLHRRDPVRAPRG